MDITKFLKSKDTSSSIDNGKRMCSVIILLHLLYRIIAQVPQNASRNINSLLSMMRLRPEGKKVPSDFDYIFSFIPDEHIKRMSLIFRYFVNYALPSKELEWIHVVPLVHFFERSVKPYDPPALTLEYITWMDDLFNWDRIRVPKAISKYAKLTRSSFSNNILVSTL